MKNLWMPLTLGLVLLAAGDALRGATFTNALTADAFVREAEPAANFGGAGAGAVSGGEALSSQEVPNGRFDTFLRVNTAAMVAAFDARFGAGNWVFTGARLRVTEVGSPNSASFNRGAGRFEVRWIANDGWTEGSGKPGAPADMGIRYQDESALLSPGSDASLGTFTNAAADATLLFELGLPEAFISDLKSGGDVSLFLTAVDPGIGFTFNSRSYVSKEARPALEVSAAGRPRIASLRVSGDETVLTAENGAAGASYRVLASTSLTAPLGAWTAVATNLPAADGTFSIPFPTPAPATVPGPQFYLLTLE